MGGDDAQKLLPRRGIYPSPGRGFSGLTCNTLGGPKRGHDSQKLRSILLLAPPVFIHYT